MARPAPARHRWVRTSAPAAGGGKRVPRVRSARQNMNAALKPEQLIADADHAHLDALKRPSSSCARWRLASSARPCFSGGKDSCVVRLAEKAFKLKSASASQWLLWLTALPARPHRHRSQLPRGHFPRPAWPRWRERPVVGHLKTPRHGHDPPGAPAGATGHQTVTRWRPSKHTSSTLLIGGARRDEEKARAKGAHLSGHRDSRPVAAPGEQRPELWTLFNTRIRLGEHFRCFPISNWTELDVWFLHRPREHPGCRYVLRAPAPVMRRRGLLVPLTDVTRRWKARRSRPWKCASAPSAT